MSDLVKRLTDKCISLSRPGIDYGETPTLLGKAASAIEARDAMLRECEKALEVSWQHAKTMRNAKDLVGPNPDNAIETRAWQRALYHEGKELMEKLKPIRTTLTRARALMENDNG